MLLNCIVIIASTKQSLYSTGNLNQSNFLVPLMIENMKLWSNLKITDCFDYYLIFFEGDVIKFINKVLWQHIHNIDNTWILIIYTWYLISTFNLICVNWRNMHYILFEISWQWNIILFNEILNRKFIWSNFPRY